MTGPCDKRPLRERPLYPLRWTPSRAGDAGVADEAGKRADSANLLFPKPRSFA